MTKMAFSAGGDGGGRSPELHAHLGKHMPSSIAGIGFQVPTPTMANKKKAPAAKPGLGWDLCVTG
jgi:hypothetical protein